MPEILTVWLLVSIVLYLGTVLDKLWWIAYPDYNYGVKVKPYWEV